jgi:tetratricopeptide (TPR) repeat protein
MCNFRKGIGSLVLIALLIVGASRADEQTPNLSAAEKYLKGDFEGSISAFNEEIERRGESAYLLYNKGLAAYQSNMRGQAIALWRRALFLDPKVTRAQEALSFAKREVPEAFEYKGLSFWAKIRKFFVVGIGLDTYLGTVAILLLITGMRWIIYFAERRKAYLSESASPALPVSGIFSGTLLIFFLILIATWSIDYLTPRVTIVADRVASRIGPGEKYAVLFEWREGQEGLVRKTVDHWAQVQRVDGKVGWIKQEAVYHTSGKAPW